HRPTTPPMLTGALHPRSVTSLSTIGPSSWGSRREGAAPLPAFPRPGPGRKRRRVEDPAAVLRKPLSAAAARARARACRAVGVPPSTSSTSLTGDLPVGNGEACPGQLGGHVVGNRSGEEHLLGITHHRGKALASPDVELGEHVVED